MLKSGETCQRCGVIKLSEDGVCSYCSELVYTQADLDKAVADEREACAKLCKCKIDSDAFSLWDRGYNTGVFDCAVAIRNRKP